MSKKEKQPAKEAIRYNGKAGNPAKNEYGLWMTGDERPVGTGDGQVPADAAEAYVESGLFEWCARPAAPAPSE